MADSVSEAVGDAAKAAVTALALADVTVVKRKNPTRPEGAGALPEVVISVGEFGAVTKIDAFTDLIKYTVAVTVITAGGEAAGDTAIAPPNGTSAATVRKWLQQIRKKLQARASWSSVPELNTVSTVGKPPFDTSALSKAFNYSMQVFTVSTTESRT